MTSVVLPGSDTNGDIEIDLNDVRIDPAWALRIPASLAIRKRILPLSEKDGKVFVACLDPNDQATSSAVSRYIEESLELVRASSHSMDRVLLRIYGGASMPGAASGRPLRMRESDARTTGDSDSEGAIALCDELMQSAVLRSASDIHIDPTKNEVLVQFRVDGQLEEYRELPSESHNGLISRFKVMAEMDIAEKRAPQDGRFTYNVGPTAQQVDVRVASLPTKHGERMTLRLLTMQSHSLTLEDLGMGTDDLSTFETAISRPHGLILLTGPTGSGKSTTLFAALSRLLQRRKVNVITIEDPVEYEIPGAAQVEVDSVDKVSFHKALRSVLRHDPDVVMLGEIRDGETADIAMKAALTGHLVFSTLHTNSASGVVTRLLDMDLQRFLVSATMRLAVAQRLVRQLCNRCSSERALSESEALAIQRPELNGVIVREPVGCLYCANRGFTGRIGLFELLPFDETLSHLVAEGAGEAEIAEFMQQTQRHALIDDAVEKLVHGQTTYAEVISAVTVW